MGAHDGMPRAYLRVDPNLDQHPDPLGMILLLCAGARQAERGRFKSQAVFVRTMGRTRATAMTRREDVETLPDGRVYIVGWDEWQEGDWTVTERMRRMRARRSGKHPPVTVPASHQRHPNVTPVTVPPSPPTVTPASPRRINVTTDAVVSTNLVDGSSTGDGGGGESRASSEDWFSPAVTSPEAPTLSYLASVGATIQPNGNGFHRRLVLLVERQGADRVLAAMQRATAAGAKSDRQYLFAAEGDLEPVGRGKAAKSTGSRGADEAERAFTRG